MMRSVSACLLAALASVALRASPTDSAIVAAMKLPDAPNYSWETAVDDDARSYAIVGKTDRATDLSLVTMPMVSAINRRMSSRGSASTDNQTTVLFNGDEKFVVQAEDGWKKPEELSGGSNARGGSRGGFGGGFGGPGGMGGRRGRRGMGGMGGRGGSFPGDNGDGRTAPAYSNLQKTLSRPHEEVAIIVAGYTEMKEEEGGMFSGTLNETAAKLLLVHAGQNEITPLKASGTFRLWIKDGVLVKYETKLDGTLSVETNGTKREVAVHQTATTTLKDVGTTKFEVPDDAKKKLGV